MALMGEMVLRVWDVQHGACAMLCHHVNGYAGRLAMIDSGDTKDWRPSAHIREVLNRSELDYLFITNADQDHISDLEGLWDAEIKVTVLVRNPHPPADELRKIKVECGMSRDIERFLRIHASYNHPVAAPFNENMGGIICRSYYNRFPHFRDTNNLSCAVFIEYAGFKILFPGDLEKPGWLALLEQEDFRSELAGTTVLVASHHGRDNGFCEEVFDYCSPRAVVFSDKPIAHETQKDMSGEYRKHVVPGGVRVRTTRRDRHVLTTRRDGWIQFTVSGDGSFFVDTECFG